MLGQEPTSETIQKTDELNKASWEKRYADLQEARKNAEQALKLSEEKDYHRGAAYARLNIAINHFLKSENQEAMEFCREALKFFMNNHSEPGYAVVLNFMGNIYESFGEYKTGLDYCQDALKAAARIEYKEGIGEIQSVIGLIYSRLSDYDRALEAYRESLVIRQEMGDQAAAASSLNRIARIFVLQKKYYEALENYNKSLEIRKELGHIGAIPWTYLGMAATYEEMGDLDNAKFYYNKNLEEGCESIDKRCKLQSILGLGRVLFQSGEKMEAGSCFKDSLALADSLKAKPLQFEAHHALADYYESMNQPDLALHHYKQFHKLREVVHNDETRNKLKNQQIAFAVEKAEKEKEIFQLRNVELKAAYDEIHEKNTEITDSINYASRIQAALLPREEILKKFLPEHFILFLPRDIVSGDYYWASQVENKVIFTAADCTGHGVPGAFMSMLGISFLNEIVDERNITDPGKILDDLRKNVMKALKQSGKEEEQKDGMDMAVCAYDTANKVLEYAGAYNPLYLVRNSELGEYKADRMPISYFGDRVDAFQTQTIKISPGDQIYIFSDGYADQFGGPEGKKFKYKTLKQLLLDIRQEPMEKQVKILKERFDEWKGEFEQIDDVVLMGVRF
jgi:serine phosphatase RsbU (regulator of sigma subunit)